MKTIFFLCFISIVFMATSCEKKNETVSTWAQGVVKDTRSEEPIADAMVYLMELENPQSGIPLFILWQPIDSMLSGTDGSFRFDYETDFEDVLYGLYAKKENYFEFQNVRSHSRQQKEAGVDLFLYPYR